MKLFGFEIRREQKAEVRKSAGTASWSWLRGEEPDGGGPWLSNAYQQVVWVYRAINVLAEQVANVPFLFSSGTRGRENLISAGPLLDFYSRPHPQLNRFQYWELRVIWLMLRGECFRVPIFGDGRGGRRLKAVLMLDPSHFQPLVEQHQLVGWRYTGIGSRTPLASQVFLPEEVWFEKLPNPFDCWRGLSPLGAAAMAAATDFSAGAFMRGIIENNADSGVIVRADKPLAPEQQEQLFAALRDRKRRAGRADQPLLVTGCAEVIKPQLSSSDLQFLENRKFSRSEICAAFGVPEEIVTSTDHAKYDVMQGARLNFIENRVAPLCGRLEAEELKTVAAIDPAAVGWFDLDSLPLMQAARRERLSTARAGFEMGVPFNELNRVLDLGFRGLPWGDQGYVPARFQPVGEGAAAPSSSASGERPARRPADVFDRFLAALDVNPRGDAGELRRPSAPPETVLSLDASIHRRTKLKESKLQRFFFEQRGRVLQAIQRVEPARSAARAEDFFDVHFENEQLHTILRGALSEDAHWSAAWTRPGLQLGPLEVSSMVDQILLEHGAGLRALLERRGEAIRQTLAPGLERQESIGQLACRLRALYNGDAVPPLRQVAVALTMAALEAGTRTALKLEDSKKEKL